ncbi:MAG: transglutaminaseTgpA domain-containing protein [Acidimicrobiales bacterium]|nr:transglutaminaseTgpA domain-containing protein [Acidimicrobiales bacterium]
MNIEELLRDTPTPSHGDGFWDAVRAEVRAHAREPNSGPAVTDEVAIIEPAELHAAGPDGRPQGARPSRRRWLVPVAVAAAIALVLFGLSAEDEEQPAVTDDRPVPGDAEVGPETRSVLSPLVQLGSLLLEQAELELFTVRVDPDHRGYWRMMALTEFEDGIWRRSSNFDPAVGAVESGVAEGVSRTTVRQEITVSGLDGIYLPAAFEVSRIVFTDGVELEYEVETGALVVEHGLAEIPDSFTYVIESAVPDYDVDSLPADAGAGVDDAFMEEHTQLPPVCSPGSTAAGRECWPEEISALAREVTAGQQTDLARAVALQSFFRDPERFVYDLDVALDQSAADIESFLAIGRGYSEQFASAFAAMARSIGIPSRVAVGFTWGEYDSALDEYLVSGKHAHAWPELYFADAGWIPFEPTPGRSSTGEQSVAPTDHTGLNWTRAAAPPGSAATISWAGSTFAAGTTEGLFLSADGASWSKVESVAGVSIEGATGDGESMVAWSDSDARLWSSVDGGNSWTEIPAGDLRPPDLRDPALGASVELAAAAVTGRTVVVVAIQDVGLDDALAALRNGGVPVPDVVVGPWPGPFRVVPAADPADAPTISYCPAFDTDTGECPTESDWDSYTLADLGIDESAVARWDPHPLVYRSVDGEAFQRVDGAPEAALLGVADGSFVAVAGDALAVSSDGVEWRERPFDGSLRSVTFADRAIYAGRGAGIIRSDDLGLTWESVRVEGGHAGFGISAGPAGIIAYGLLDTDDLSDPRVVAWSTADEDELSDWTLTETILASDLSVMSAAVGTDRVVLQLTSGVSGSSPEPSGIAVGVVVSP